MAFVEYELLTVPIEQISIHLLNVRQIRRAEDLRRIKNSIKKNGLGYPLKVVREDGKGYACYDGGFRLTALKELGVKKVPIIVANKTTNKEIIIGSLVTAESSTPLNCLEKAQAFENLMNECGGDRKKVDALTGAGLGNLSQILSVLKLCRSAKQAIMEGRMRRGTAQVLAKETPRMQARVMAKVWDEKIIEKYHVERSLAAMRPREVQPPRRPLYNVRVPPTSPTPTDDTPEKFDVLARRHGFKPPTLKDILLHKLKGYTNTEIAIETGISRLTVVKYQQRLKKSLVWAELFDMLKSLSHEVGGRDGVKK